MIANLGAFPVTNSSALPAVTAATMAEVDRLAIDQFGIGLLQMMEQAGSHMAELVRVEIGGGLSGRRIIVAIGPGNNGGGGLAAARHLVNRGASVRVVLSRPVNRLVPAARHQVATLLEMSVDCCVAIYDVPDDKFEQDLARADAVVDALIGYRGAGAPRDGVRWLLERIARSAAPVLSLDLPSGIDADAGEANEPTVCAAATLALALPKRGLFVGAGPSHAGRVHLADLGLPLALYERLGIALRTPFAHGPIVQLRDDA